MTPLKPIEIRALLNDACDFTLPQARKQFAEFLETEQSNPEDHILATIINLLDAIFYLRFGGQWRATAAPHAFLPLPSKSLPAPKPSPSSAPYGIGHVIRNISRDLFR